MNKKFRVTAIGSDIEMQNTVTVLKLCPAWKNITVILSTCEGKVSVWLIKILLIYLLVSKLILEE